MALKVGAEGKKAGETVTLAWSDGKLYSGTEDGSIKTWDEKLVDGSRWRAHTATLFALAAGGERVYSASNDGGIRVWDDTGKCMAELTTSDSDVEALVLDGYTLYAGDEQGTVYVFEENKLRASFEMAEEVKDLAHSGDLLFTVRDLDITITDIHPETGRWMMRQSLEGRAPLRVANDIVLAMARSGKDMICYRNSIKESFPKLSEVEVSDMIVNALALSPDGREAWTGGWDGRVKRWSVSSTGTLKCTGEMNMGGAVRALIAPKRGAVYAAVAGSRLLRIDA